MPKALCFKCGEIKDDAWGPCGSCHNAPQSEDELATSLALTEDHFGEPTLKSFGNLIKSGQYPKLSDDTKQEFLKLAKEAEGESLQAPELTLETQPVLRFNPTGSQLFFRNLFSLVGIQFVIAATAIGCTWGFLYFQLPDKQEKFLLYCAIGAAVLGAVIMPAVAWFKPKLVPSQSWFMTGAYIAGFGSPVTYMVMKYLM